MMKTIFIIATSVISTSMALAQPPASSQHHAYATGASQTDTSSSVNALGNSNAPYTFKVARIGMSLEEFKKATGGETFDLWGPSHSIFKRGTLEIVGKAQTPYCSDGPPIAFPEGSPPFLFPAGDAPLGQGEVNCNPSPKNANQSLLKVAGLQLIDCIYYFYNGRLYKIRFQFFSGDYDDLLTAFSEKYGSPTQEKPDYYSNGFGARWVGKNYSWRNGTEEIFLVQGAGNGPAQTQAGYSLGLIQDSALAPPAQPKKPLDF